MVQKRNGLPLRYSSEVLYQALLAKDLLLEYEDMEYPENVISYSQRKAYKKKLLKKQKNENLQ